MRLTTRRPKLGTCAPFVSAEGSVLPDVAAPGHQQCLGAKENHCPGSMTLAKDITLAMSILLVAVGRLLTNTGLPVGGGPSFYANEALLAEMRRVGRRKLKQRRVGLALVLSGCALQAASLFLLP